MNIMIPSSTLSTPSTPTIHNGFPARSLSANLSPPLTQKRRRNNKNLSLCLSSTDQGLDSIPPSTPFVSTCLQQQQQQHYYQQGPSVILPGLYLADELSANNVQQLSDLSIHCVLNVAAEVDHPYEHVFQPWDRMFLNTSTSTSTTITPCPTLSSSSTSSASTISTNLTLPPPPPPTDIFSTMGYKKRSWHHRILDSDEQHAIQKELDGVVKDIARARQAGLNVLVHCQCGLARSATVVVAYVMYELGLSMSAAMLHVKTHAPHINPNLSLIYRLREYELWLLATRHDSTHGAYSFLKKQQASLVAKCKSFKFNKASSPS